MQNGRERHEDKTGGGEVGRSSGKGKKRSERERREEGKRGREGAHGRGKGWKMQGEGGTEDQIPGSR